MANFNCYIRFYLPLNSSNIPNTDNVGWCDLQIDGLNGASLEFDEFTTVKSPVFAFGSDGGKGYVRIFPAAKTLDIYTSPLLLCMFKFTATQAQVTNFLDNIRTPGLLTFQRKTNYYSLYKVTSGPFQVYTKERYNTMGATATWANWLGDSRLKTIYDKYTDGSTGYKKYATWELFNEFYTAWSFVALNKAS